VAFRYVHAHVIVVGMVQTLYMVLFSHTSFIFTIDDSFRYVCIDIGRLMDRWKDGKAMYE
jgi:hypothetical protein